MSEIAQDVSLREYVDLKVGHEGALRQIQIAATEKALILAKDTTKYVPHDWYEKSQAMFEERVRTLESFKSNIEGRMVAYGIVITLINLALVVAAIVITIWIKK